MSSKIKSSQDRSRGCLECVWRISRGYLKDVWWVFAVYKEGVWRKERKCLKSVKIFKTLYFLEAIFLQPKISFGPNVFWTLFISIFVIQTFWIVHYNYPLPILCDTYSCWPIFMDLIICVTIIHRSKLSSFLAKINTRKEMTWLVASCCFLC